MTSWLELPSRGLQWIVSAVLSFLLWTFWLVLGLLLVFQLYVLSANELAIPDFALRRLQAKLAQSGLRATFDRTAFDPTGRVLIENVRLSLPAFAEPIVTVRSVYVRLNPWPLLLGRIEPREIRITDGSASVPAMLSPSGEAQEIVRSLNAALDAAGATLDISQLDARVAGVPVSASGVLKLPPRRAAGPRSDSLENFVAKEFPRLCRQALAFSEQLAQCEEPSLRLAFSPSAGGAPIVDVLALARAIWLTKPFAAEITDFRATTKLLLFGDAPPSDIALAASELRLPADSRARGVKARIVGRFRLDGRQFDLRELTLTADALASSGVDARAASVEVFPRALQRFQATAGALLLDASLAVQAEGDLSAQRGLLRFEGAVSPRVLDVVSARVGKDVRKYFSFDSMTAERGEARFGAGWKFEEVDVRVRIPRMNSYGVIMEDGRATLSLNPQRLHAPEAFARVGDNFARGSYEHDLKSHAYRFLLEGQLRPLEISKWFRPWWASFFQQLEFLAAPPAASVDVQGVWRDGRQVNVFVFADAREPGVRGVAFERVRTRLFIRPAFIDGLEVFANRGADDVHGRFTYIANPETRVWQKLELGLDSTLGLGVAAELLGPAGANALAPFRLAAPPQVKFRGQFAGPDAPADFTDKLRIEARTKGDFRFHEFPLRDVSFLATVDRDEIAIDDFEGKFAGGTARGRALVSGIGDRRQLGFEATVEGAALGQVAAGLGEFFAARKGQAAAAPGKFVTEKANVQIAVSASAEGRYNDPYSYHGEGKARLHGAEIGDVALLGALSELLTFTTLRFNEARADFKVNGAKLEFPDVALRGADAAVDAQGSYALDRRELNFNAKIFPFQESGNLLKSVVGAVLTPLSNALEVKLTGSLTKPEWSFAKGPANLLRSLAPTANATAKPAPEAAAAAPR